ncbi:MAG: tetratricopeptide repeat protein [Planctomycetota bacterium]|nr:tetratricopeptide repeat protein [Planctomycetota bacterium]
MGVRLIAFFALAALVAGCSDEVEAGSRVAGDAGGIRAVGGPRSADPRVVAVRAALAGGRLDVADTLLAQVGEAAGIESPLLRARLALYRGDGIGALREVEAARAAWPGDGRVYAMAAEVYAALGRFQAANEELGAGLREAGRTADLERSTGVCLIAQSGGVARGLEHLERAQKLDPELPFLARPLQQAHLLRGRRALGEDDPVAAMQHAKAAAALWPDDLDVLELEADARASLLDFDRAIELYGRLEAAGRATGDTRALLHKSAGTAELLVGNRAQAVEHFRRARELGMDEAGLGFGATLLSEEVGRRVEAGIAAYEAGDLPAARAAFEGALELDAKNHEARNHLGVVCFRAEDYAAAAACWREVLDAAAAGAVDLPEPVHINLSRALDLAGKKSAALAVLDAYLEREPEGEWAPLTVEARRRLAP